MMTDKYLIKQLNASMKRIGKERDILRNLIEDYEDLSDNCDEALDDLQRAVDALSKRV